jgi:hypothetical protein
VGIKVRKTIERGRADRQSHRVGRPSSALGLSARLKSLALQSAAVGAPGLFCGAARWSSEKGLSEQCEELFHCSGAIGTLRSMGRHIESQATVLADAAVEPAADRGSLRECQILAAVHLEPQRHPRVDLVDVLPARPSTSREREEQLVVSNASAKVVDEVAE